MGCTGCSLGTSANPGGNYVGVRLADAEDGKTTLVLTGEVHVGVGEHLIVEIDSGPEFAEVTTATPMLGKACSSKKAKRFLRLASDSEYADYVDRLEVQDRAYRFALERVSALGLDLRVVKCALGFDRRKITVLYTADNRVETRDFIRDMSNELKMRVEMKMIGVRDETKLIGGIGSGRPTARFSNLAKGFPPADIRTAEGAGVNPEPPQLTLPLRRA